MVGERFSELLAGVYLRSKQGTITGSPAYGARVRHVSTSTVEIRSRISSIATLAERSGMQLERGHSNESGQSDNLMPEGFAREDSLPAAIRAKSAP